MPAPGPEDAAIMFERATLERFWLSTLNNTEREDWLARWETRPPMDAIGRVYTPNERTTLQQTRRPPETIYAWSQIFGTYRLGRAPVRTPIDAAEITLDHTAGVITYGEISLTVTPSPAHAAPLDVILHATEPLSAGVTNIAAHLRPIGQRRGVTTGTVLDMTNDWLARYEPKQGRAVAIRVQVVNVNNEVTPTAALLVQRIVI